MKKEAKKEAKEAKNAKKVMLQGFLIDPFKQEMRRIEISSDPDIWRKVMRCDWYEVLSISTTGEQTMDLWFDEEGRVKPNPFPRFRIDRGASMGGGTFEIHGYALAFSSNSEGETIDLKSTPISASLFGVLSELAYEITEKEFIEEKLRMIELAEYVLRDLGFHDVRVRHHELQKQNLARIELAPAEIPTLLANGKLATVAEELKKIGYAHVTLDLQGYRRGSTNEVLGMAV